MEESINPFPKYEGKTTEELFPFLSSIIRQVSEEGLNTQEQYKELYGKVFPFKFINTPIRTVTEVKEAYFVLFKDFFHYKVVAKADVEKDGDIKPYRYNYRCTRRRRDMAGVEMYYSNNEAAYIITLEFKSVGEQIDIFFATGKEAKEYYDILENYLITENLLK